ncbi:MAPEG family protein [Thiomicrorhabdus sp.]|uniref:MAPEG family protein n=1 Tax=Thiomicrorhabdus sp. TaxID=2039724 RepID=UPI0029C79F98|nr:MAPEG family protein [Thiomicrorhabdus sp.]
MQQEWILFPLIALVIWTLLVGFRMLQLRVKAVRQDGLNPHYFLLNRGGKLPAYLTQIEQHYQNLFELPVLFYLLAITLFASKQVDALQLYLAWIFVTSRIVHSFIHLGSNRLIWRRNTFLFGGAILLIAWLDFAWKLLTLFT